MDRIDPFLCTHVVYAFAVLDPVTLTIQSGDPTVDVAENGYVIQYINLVRPYGGVLFYLSHLNLLFFFSTSYIDIRILLL